MNTFTDANMIVARTHCQSNGLFAQRSRSLPCLSTAAGIGHLSSRRRIRARVDRDDGEVHARGASSNSRGFVREAGQDLQSFLFRKYLIERVGRPLFSLLYTVNGFLRGRIDVPQVADAFLN